MLKFINQYLSGKQNHKLKFKFKVAREVLIGITITLVVYSNLIRPINAQDNLAFAEEFQDNAQNTQNETINQQSIKQSYFTYGIKMIPHKDKIHKGGEDAYYADDQLLVVLDGVGGWTMSGVDPGLFSKQLAKFIAEENKLRGPKETLKNILVESVKRTTFTGSSTACLVRLDQDSEGGQTLQTTNLGDSGYAIFRIVDSLSKDGQEHIPIILMQFRSKEQQYSFNFPYQCGTGSELPYAAEDNTHQLEENDIVLLGSDGLFDNVYDEDLLTCLYPQLDINTKRLKNLTEASECLANKAEKHGYDNTYLSPFAKQGREALKIPSFIGGKADDITVIVAQFNKLKTNDIQ